MFSDSTLYPNVHLLCLINVGVGSYVIIVYSPFLGVPSCKKKANLSRYALVMTESSLLKEKYPLEKAIKCEKENARCERRQVIAIDFHSCS